ncbi:hypothetical protein Tco_1031309 [Tanacetum coccineum]|uniref:Uncharacterized protein n=1 Tax=Tanacetum coccineum TaxID=301880 RepID=A0ABQ5GAC0_9ASTR
MLHGLECGACWSMAFVVGELDEEVHTSYVFNAKINEALVDDDVVAARFLYHLFLCDLSFAHLDKVKFLVAPKVGAATDALPAGVLKLDTHSSSKADPSESSPLPISVAPMIPTAPILPAQSAVIAPSHEFPLAPIDAPTRIRRRRAILIQPGEDIPIGRLYRTHPGGPCRALTARKSVRPLPSHRLALRCPQLDQTATIDAWMIEEMNG